MKKVAEWYRTDNYITKGTLNSSCMRKKRKEIFDIYSKNPDVCKLLILLTDGVLSGRALVWKLSTCTEMTVPIEGIEFFMDRQYTSNDSDVILFREYAEKNGWAYKTKNTHHNLEEITFDGREIHAYMTIKIENNDIEEWPYVDTFRLYDTHNKTLLNKDKDTSIKSEINGFYILDQTDGGHGIENHAVWSEYADSYIDYNRSICVQDGDRSHRGYYPEDCDEVELDGWDEVYYHTDDMVYCEVYEYGIYYQNAIEIIVNIEKDGDFLTSYCHKNDLSIIKNTSIVNTVWYGVLMSSENLGILKKLVTYPENGLNEYDGKPILEKFSIELFTVTNSDLYLSKFDADILKLQIESNNPITIDQFIYHKDYMTGDILKELLNALNEIALGDSKSESILSRISEIENKIFVTK